MTDTALNTRKIKIKHGRIFYGKCFVDAALDRLGDFFLIHLEVDDTYRRLVNIFRVTLMRLKVVIFATCVIVRYLNKFVFLLIDLYRFLRLSTS